MNPWPSGVEGSSRSAASERGVRVVDWVGASGLGDCGKSVRSRSRASGIGGRYGGSPIFLNRADGDLKVALRVMRDESCSGVVLGKVAMMERAASQSNAVHSAGALPALRDAARWLRIGVRFFRRSDGSTGNRSMRVMQWMATLGASSSRFVSAWNRKDWRAASTGMVAARDREGIALECTWWSECGESVVCFRGMDWKNSRFGVK